MSELTRRAARGTVMLMGAQVCLTASGYVIAVVLARELGPSLYGVYGIVYSFLLAIELIARLGIPQALSKLIAEQRERTPRLEATGVTLTLVIYLSGFVVFWLASPVLAEMFHVPDGARLFRVACLDIPFYGLYFMAIHILNGRRQFATESLATVVYALSKVIGVFVLVHYGPSVAGALIVNIVASVVALLFALQRTGLEVFRFTLEFRAPIVRLAVPVGLVALGTQLLSNVDLWLLNAIGIAAEEVKGHYVAALNLARAPNLAAFVMAAVLIPSVSRALAMQDRDAAERAVRGGMRFLAITLLPGCALIAIEAEGLMALVFADRYADAAPLLAVLIFGPGLSYTIFMTLCSVLIASGRSRRAAEIALGVLPIAAALNAVLITGFEAVGAAVAALLSTSLAALVSGYFVHRAIGSPVEIPVLAKALSATAAVSVAAFLIPSEGISLLIELSVLSIGYLCLLGVLGLLTRNDIALLLPVRARGK